MAQEVDTASKVIEATKLEEILAEYHHGIAYKPQADEPDPFALLPLVREKIAYMILPDAQRDPIQEAGIVMGIFGSEEAAGQKTFILIPGQKFDASGTRHGHGGGWYDHFLDRVPRSWLRIGLSMPAQFSEEPLVRQPWDEEMDYVCIAP